MCRIYKMHGSVYGAYHAYSVVFRLKNKNYVTVKIINKRTPIDLLIFIMKIGKKVNMNDHNKLWIIEK